MTRRALFRILPFFAGFGVRKPCDSAPLGSARLPKLMPHETEAREIVRLAMIHAGICHPAEAPAETQIQYGLTKLDDMLAAWRQRGETGTREDVIHYLAYRLAPLYLSNWSSEESERALAKSHTVWGSFDGADWGKAFVGYAKQCPWLPLNELGMTAWFSQALNRGYDEREHHFLLAVEKAGESYARRLTREAIAGAVARGWCADANRHKEMDCHLAMAITNELMELA